MIVRKTVRVFNRRVSSWKPRKLMGIGPTTHTEQVFRKTWWFLFVPILRVDQLLKSSLESC